MFKIPFLTTFVPIKTLYDQIWNILVDQIYLIFEFFESEFFWRLLEGERCILEGWSWKSILFIMTFLITFISNIKLYNSIIKLFSILGENIKKSSWFFSFFMSFLPNLPYFFHFSRKIMKVYFNQHSKNQLRDHKNVCFDLKRLMLDKKNVISIWI